MKPFYVHKTRVCYKNDPARIKHLPRGFTALIQDDPQNKHHCLFSIVYCSSKDVFSKKKGREFVADVIPTSINKRDVPKQLALAEIHICRWADKASVHDWKAVESDYYYLYMYML